MCERDLYRNGVHRYQPSRGHHLRLLTQRADGSTAAGSGPNAINVTPVTAELSSKPGAITPCRPGVVQQNFATISALAAISAARPSPTSWGMPWGASGIL
ncbi:hypothetical protein M8494_11685 [Serratia ureilytica]